MNSLKRLIPNLFTAGNLVGGILAIIFTLTGKIHLAPFCIFASAIFDFLDGFMARLLKVPSELGKQLDSLADMVTFGVAPGVIVYELIRNVTVIDFIYQDSPPSGQIRYFPLEGTTTKFEMLMGFNFLPYLAFVIPVFALFRLAKFNLDTRQSDSFIGVPTPAATLFFAVLPLLVFYTYRSVLMGEYHLGSWQYLAAQTIMNPYFLIISSLVMSILMVVELPLFALKFKHFKWKGNEIRFIFLTICILLLATLFFWAIPLIIILYVILSLINTRIAK